MTLPVLIVGASARAAAMSAVRSGLEFTAIDLFADEDLRQLAATGHVMSCRRLKDLARAHHELPAGPWFYTGGLENLASVVQCISQHRRLWGNGAECLRRARSIRRLYPELSRHGFRVPQIAPRGAVPERGTWLVKPRRSCGGLRIRWAKGGESIDPAGRYLVQEFVPGPAYSGSYLASPSGCSWIGASRQRTRRDLPEAGPTKHPFQYWGSVVGPFEPLTLDGDSWSGRWTQLGRVVANQFGLRGLFGVDAVLASDEEGRRQLVPLEVNPRYTASMELFEQERQFEAILAHREACTTDDFLWNGPVVFANWWQKLIVYAREEISVDASFVRALQAQNRDPLWPAVADIPHPGGRIAAGQPVCTVLTCASSESELARKIPGLGKVSWARVS